MKLKIIGHQVNEAIEAHKNDNQDTLVIKKEVEPVQDAILSAAIVDHENVSKKLIKKVEEEDGQNKVVDQIEKTIKDNKVKYPKSSVTFKPYESLMVKDRKEAGSFIKEAIAQNKKYTMTRSANPAYRYDLKFNEEITFMGKDAIKLHLRSLTEDLKNEDMPVYKDAWKAVRDISKAMQVLVDLYEANPHNYDILNEMPGYPEHWKSLDEEVALVENFADNIQEIIEDMGGSVEDIEEIKVNEDINEFKQAKYDDNHRFLAPEFLDTDDKFYLFMNDLVSSEDDKNWEGVSDKEKEVLEHVRDFHKEYFDKIKNKEFVKYEDFYKVLEDAYDGDLKDLHECNNQKLTEEPVFDLATRYDSRQSFYGKARVEADDKGNYILWSYSTPVCKIFTDKNGERKAVLLRRGYYGWFSSPTTLRHVKEFLKQNGFKADTKDQIAKDYPEEDYNG